MGWINAFFGEFYRLMSEMAPFLLLGFLFAGMLRALFPTDGIARFMGRRNFRSVLNAALLGVPLPLCSCGVIPTAISFYRSGASKGATTSFLISTPQTGVDSILATYAMLGLPFAIIRVIVAFFTGLLGGTASHLLDRDQDGVTKDLKEFQPEKLTFIGKIRLIFTYGFGELVEDIVKWLLIGLALAAVLSLVIPDSFFTTYIGNQWIEMLIVLSASIPLYICATGSIPMAAVLLLKGISPGAALVFLMAGPATNIATMMVIGNSMGRKAFFIYLGSIVSGALLSGFIVNTFLPAGWFQVGHLYAHQHDGTSWITVASAILLSGLMLLAIWKKWIQPLLKTKTPAMSTTENSFFTTLSVGGMTCNHCKATVEKNISAIEGVDEVMVDLNAGSVKVGGNHIDFDRIVLRIKELGYEYQGKI
jgi:uncharacterized membrane protein YraQ (UPF0718 family)